MINYIILFCPLMVVNAECRLRLELYRDHFRRYIGGGGGSCVSRTLFDF